MAWNECDTCKGTKYTEENPFIEMCQQRPSCKEEMCCVLAGHKNCIGAQQTKLPSIGETGGVATPEQWEHWIENEGMKLGYLWLS